MRFERGLVCFGRPCDLPGLCCEHEVRHEASMIEWTERSNGGPSQRVVEAGGSLALEAQGAGGSGPDNDGTGRHRQTARVRQARREGVARANQWSNPLKRGSGSNLADVGRDAAHAGPWWAGDSVAGISWLARRPWGRSAAYSWRGCRGKAGRRPRRSISDERGNHLGPPTVGGQARCRLLAPEVGRSLRSSPSRGKPGTWRREAADLQHPSGRRGGRR
jgi:hypothetical protein